MKFKHCLVAGTFDHLHSGHLALLSTALKHSSHITCGLTKKPLLSQKALPDLIQSFKARYQKLHSFFFGSQIPVSFFPLTNALQPADSSTKFDSLIVSQQTAPAAHKINSLRLKKNLPPLKTIIIDLVKSSDHQVLSSTRIRQGQINRTGYAYHQAFSQKTLTLPALHRHHFKKPFDALLSGSQTHLGWAGLKAVKIIQTQSPFMTITVGDIATLTLTRQGLTPDLSIIDLKTNRQKIFNSLQKLGLYQPPQYLVKNPPAKLTPELIKSLIKTFNSYLINPSSQSILIQGEEDLTVLPAILLSPLKSAVFYGQPDKGLVYINVTEKTKAKALKLIQKFV